VVKVQLLLSFSLFPSPSIHSPFLQDTCDPERSVIFMDILVTLFITVTKYLTETTWGIILAHGFRGMAHGYLAPCAWAGHHVHLMVDRKQRGGSRKGPGTRYPQGPAFSDLLPPARSHLLKFPKPPKITPPAGDLGLNTWVSGDISYSNHNNGLWWVLA
jgi:hypothetical protein